MLRKGGTGDKRYYHHVVINAAGPEDRELIYSLWQYSEIVDIECIAGHEHIEITKYIKKENTEDRPNGAQMWTRSRNLESPKVESSFIPDDEMKP